MRFNLEDNKITQNDENHAFFKNCVRFNRHDTEINDTETASVYIQLRSKGCQKNKALNYCTSQHCKIDITADKLGPSSCKRLKAIVNPINLYYGWQIAGKLNYSNDSINSNIQYQSILSEKDEFNNLLKHEKSLRDMENNQKMGYLKEFYQQMNEKFKFSKISNNEVLNRIKQLEDAKMARDDEFKNILKGVGIKFQEMSEVYEEERSNLKNNNVIFKLKAFNRVIPKNEEHKFQWKKKYTENKFEKQQHNQIEILPPLISNIQSGIMDPIEVSQERETKMSIYKPKSPSLKTNKMFQESTSFYDQQSGEQSVRQKKIQQIKASQFIYQQNILLDSGDMKGYLQFEKNLDNLARDKLARILNPKELASIPKVDSSRQNSLEESATIPQPITNLETTENSLQILQESFQKDQYKLNSRIYGNHLPRIRSFSQKESLNKRMKLNLRAKRRMLILEQDELDIHQKEHQGLYKHILKNYGGNKSKADQIYEKILKRLKRTTKKDEVITE